MAIFNESRKSIVTDFLSFEDLPDEYFTLAGKLLGYTKKNNKSDILNAIKHGFYFLKKESYLTVQYEGSDISLDSIIRDISISD